MKFIRETNIEYIKVTPVPPQKFKVDNTKIEVPCATFKQVTFIQKLLNQLGRKQTRKEIADQFDKNTANSCINELLREIGLNSIK